MNFIDVLLLIIILLSVASGWQKGFITGTLELIIWAGSLLTGLWLYQYVAAFIEEQVTSLGVWTPPVAFIFVVFIAWMVIASIMYRIASPVAEKTHHHFINKVFGIVPGLFKGFLYAAIIATLLLVIPISNSFSGKVRDSRLATWLTAKVEKLEAAFSPVFDEAVKRSMTKLTVNPGSEKSIDLPFTVKDPQVRKDLEAGMLKMLNEERVKAGLSPLKADPELAEVARSHSGDMFARGYFSHVTPEGKYPLDRIRRAGVTFLTAGENLALAQTLSIAHEGLMDSPGHRANILRPAFGRVGIGILDGGMYGIMVTQNFRN